MSRAASQTGFMTNHYENRCVRDLAWVIGSPALVANDSHWVSSEVALQELRSHGRWLEELDRDPETLVEFLKSRDCRRLGRYFEALHSFWFHFAPNRRLLAENLAVRDAKGRTLGELDFLYEDDAGIVHCEVAVKFYLRAGSGLSGYVGPSLRDRLDWKLEKLANQQVHRTDLPETQAALSAKGIHVSPREIRREVRLKGVLFEHDSTPRPPGIDSRCLKGHWITLHDIKRLPDEGWVILRKLEWLSGPPLQCAAMSLVEVQKAFEAHQNFSPAQLGRIENGSVGTRVFVVPESWPAAAARITTSERTPSGPRTEGEPQASVPPPSPDDQT